jgi:hypothetical protein
MGKAAGLFLLVLGLVLGPGSYVASRFFSGRVIVEAPLTFETGIDGRLRSRFAFSLPADALPAAVVIQASASHGPALLPADPPGDTWTLRLLQDGHPIRELPMHLQSTTVEATPTLVFKESISLDAAQGGGNYVLEIALPAVPRLTLDSARIEVRAGVTPANPSWLIGGLALLVAGLALLLSA